MLSRMCNQRKITWGFSLMWHISEGKRNCKRDRHRIKRARFRSMRTSLFFMSHVWTILQRMYMWIVIGWKISKVNSVQEACVKCFAVQYWNLKSFKSHEINQTKNIRLLVFSFSPLDLAFWCFLFCFFMWFERFQILICEPQRIWRKLLVLSWL